MGAMAQRLLHANVIRHTHAEHVFRTSQSVRAAGPRVLGLACDRFSESEKSRVLMSVATTEGDAHLTSPRRQPWETVVSRDLGLLRRRLSSGCPGFGYLL